MPSFYNKKITITTPSLSDKGGVSSFFNSLLPYLRSKFVISVLEVGFTHGNSKFFYYIYDQFRFNNIILSDNFIIHINPSLNLKSFFRDGFFVYQAKKRNVPVIIFFHGWNKQFEQVVSRYFLWFFKKTFGKADAFVVLASSFAVALRNWSVQKTVYQLTTCVDDSLLFGFDPVIKMNLLRSSPLLRILFLARLDRAKGVFETVQAFKLLIDKKLPVTLTVAGSGRIAEELKKFSASLGLTSQHISFTGDIRGREKIQAFVDHHIYCLPSYGEGLPTSVLEAMAFGMPVVTCPVGGLVDVFEDGVMGYFTGTTPEAIAASLERLVINRQHLVQIGQFNYEHAQKNFLASVVAKRLEEIYKEILHDKS